jgi:hypothetical protein
MVTRKIAYNAPPITIQMDNVNRGRNPFGEKINKKAFKRAMTSFYPVEQQSSLDKNERQQL